MIRATSQTGATYDLDGMFWRHREGEWHRREQMRNVDYLEAHDRVNTPDFWPYVNSQPDVEMPQIGKCLFVASIECWRISTPIVKIEVI